MTQSRPSVRLTDQVLQELKARGFQYVLVKGYTPERGQHHIQLNHIIIVPVVQLPTEPGEKEIYALIDSEILSDWANCSDAGLEVYIEFG